MDDTTKRQLRAYMVYRQGRIYPAGSGVARIAVEFENTGQTPAIDLQGYGKDGFEVWPVKVDDPGPPPPHSLQSSAVVGAGKSFNYSKLVPWNSVIVSDLSRGPRVYVMVGVFTYRDIFGREWKLRFQVGIGGPFGQPDLVSTQDEGEYYRLITDRDGNYVT
jgi:hypothetical protein